MERREKGIGDILSTMTIAILFLVIILLVVFSASAYRQATDGQQENDNSRAVLSYVVTAVKDNITADIRPKSFSGADGLSISSDDMEYERKIYVKDGKLLEEYGVKGKEISPESALKIGKLKEFEVKYIENDLLEIRTDKGTSYVRTKRL